MKRRRRALPAQAPPAYPSLADHRQSRRGFLAGSAAMLGAGALAACSRPFGAGEGNQNIPGDVSQPHFYPLRFPVEGDASVWLVDGGYATYYVTAVTYAQDVALFVEDQRAALESRIASVIGERTYDELVTSNGATMDALRDAVASSPNEAYNEDTGDVGTDWFQQVDVIFSRLDPPAEIGGVAGEDPSYP